MSCHQDQIEIWEKQLKSYYDTQMTPALHLQCKVAEIISHHRGNNDVEKQSLENDLNDVSNDLTKSKEALDLSLTSEIKKIQSSTSSENFFEILMKFRDSCEEMKISIAKLLNKLEDIQERYAITEENKLSRQIRSTSIELGLALEEPIQGLHIYKLPLQEVHKITSDKIRRFELGRVQMERDHRHILLTGMTGSGKSLLINNMINYIYGVSYKDNFRFKLIVESEEEMELEDGEAGNHRNHQAGSKTSWVTSYTFHWQDGFRIPYSLTIIDTPGFGDTRGLQYDEVIVSQIRKFLHDHKLCPNQELTCIGLVIQASQARITEEQKYIFDQVQNLFGKDMAKNIFIVFTFADAQDPPALKVIQSENIPFSEGCTFKFNNSAVYASNENNPSTSFVWNFGYENLDHFFKELGNTEQKSLGLTKEVLIKREKLRSILTTLQKKISNGMDTLRQIEDQSRIILKLDGTINANRHFKVKRETFRCNLRQVDHNITNCRVCMQTCHDPCDIKEDRKMACAVIDENGICEVCPKRCSSEKHSNGTHCYVYVPVEIEETIEDMMIVFNVAVGEKNDKKKFLQTLLSKYQEQKHDVYDSIKRANDYSNQLMDIALRYTYLSNVDYIDRLIYFEECSSNLNKTNRIQQLRHIREMAEILRDVKEDPQSLTLHVSSYEKEIIQIIDNMEDEEEDSKV